MFLNMHFLGFKMERARTPNVDLPSFAVETSKKLFQILLLFLQFSNIPFGILMKS